MSANSYNLPLDMTYAFNPITEPIKLIPFRDYKIDNYGEIDDFLLYFDWMATFINYNVNNTARILNEALFVCIDKFVPIKT